MLVVLIAVVGSLLFAFAWRTVHQRHAPRPGIEPSDWSPLSSKMAWIFATTPSLRVVRSFSQTIGFALGGIYLVLMGLLIAGMVVTPFVVVWLLWTE